MYAIRMFFANKFYFVVILFSFTLCFSNSLLAEQRDDAQDLFDLSFEELLNVRVSTPTKTQHETWLSPSSVSVINRQQIENYGYQTVWDALQTVVGSLPAFDGNSAQLSFRGALEPGSFGNRFIMMINGHKVSHSYFQWTSVNESLGLAIDNIERIVIVRGPGSVLHGSNAFDAVINVITRDAKQLNGFEVVTKIAAHTNATGNSPVEAERNINRIITSLSYATTHNDGSNTLVSATRNESKGHKLWLPYFQATGQGGIADKVDDKLSEFFWLKHQRKNLSFSAQYSEVDFGRPLAPFFATPNSDLTRNNVRKYFIELAHQLALNNNIDLETRIYHDRNDFTASWFYQGFSPLDRQIVPSKLTGIESFAVHSMADNELVIGAEFEQHQTSQIEDYPSEDNFFRFDAFKFNQHAIYFQNQYTISPSLLWNISARYEDNSDYGSVNVKRTSLVYQPLPDMAFRLHLGEAFRAPLLHDFFYQSSILNLPQNKIQKLSFEKTKSVEVGFNKRADNYQFDILFYRDTDENVVKYNASKDHYFNARGDISKGLEMVLDYQWSRELNGYFNFTYVDTPRDSEGEKFNAPRYSIKLGSTYQILSDKRLSLAVEGQYYADQDYVDHSARIGVDLQQTAYSIFNLNLLSKNNPLDLDINFRIDNLFNRSFEYPIFKGTRQGYPSIGRSVMLSLSKVF